MKYILFFFCGCCLVYVYVMFYFFFFFFFFKQKTSYEMRISDWSSDVCSSDLVDLDRQSRIARRLDPAQRDGQIADACDMAERRRIERVEIGRASCRERVCQYV